MNRRDLLGMLSLIGAVGGSGLAAGTLLTGPSKRVRQLSAERRKVLTKGPATRQLPLEPAAWGLPGDAVLVGEWIEPETDVRYLKWAHKLFKLTAEAAAFTVVAFMDAGGDIWKLPPEMYREDCPPHECPPRRLGPWGPTGQVGDIGGGVISSHGKVEFRTYSALAYI